MKVPCALAPVLFLLVACGGVSTSGGNAPLVVTPVLVPGGGARDPGIRGTVNVFVFDERTGLPVAGASVKVGALDGITTTSGLFVANGALVGKQAVAVKAAGYAASLWVGVDAANLTIPLAPSQQPADPPKATVAGSVVGWDSVPVPGSGHATVARVGASRSPNVDDPGNNLPPTLAAECLKLPTSSPACAWSATVRAGTVALGAVIADQDTRGTLDPSDDLFTVINYATRSPVAVVDGVGQAGQDLALLPAGGLVATSTDFGTPPAALPNVTGYVGIDLGTAGILEFPMASSTPSAPAVMLPGLGAFPGATYRLRALAVDAAGVAESLVLRTGIGATGGLATGAWLASPSGLACDRITVTAASPVGASFLRFDVDTRPASGLPVPAMRILVLDGSTSVALPVTFAPLPAGPLSVRAMASDVGAFDGRQFQLTALGTLLQRRSSISLPVD